jgi:hypothetical protein
MRMTSINPGIIRLSRTDRTGDAPKRACLANCPVMRQRSCRLAHTYRSVASYPTRIQRNPAGLETRAASIFESAATSCFPQPATTGSLRRLCADRLHGCPRISALRRGLDREGRVRFLRLTSQGTTVSGPAARCWRAALAKHPRGQGATHHWLSSCSNAPAFRRWTLRSQGSDGHHQPPYPGAPP